MGPARGEGILTGSLELFGNSSSHHTGSDLNHNNTISRASRETLLYSQNAAFMELFLENLELKAELKAQKATRSTYDGKRQASVAQPSSQTPLSSEPPPKSPPSSQRSSKPSPSFCAPSAINTPPDTQLTLPELKT